MMIDTWDEIRTAFQVARLGTVSGAAEVLGVHHATVIRHIDALEKRLGSKLFQRHARGYTPTEAGQELLKVAQTTEDQFNQLVSRIKGQGETVSGELVVTSVTGISHILTPVFAAYQQAYPDVRIRFISDMRLVRLDYGEAHVAIRAGGPPQEPDNVVQPLARLQMGLYAATSYVQTHGRPAGPEDFARHRFIGPESSEHRAPFHRWLAAHAPADRIVYRSSEPEAIEQAVLNGLGIGFMRSWEARQNPLVTEILPPNSDWDSPLWIVTHVDLHRTLKVQTFLATLKDHAQHWGLHVTPSARGHLAMLGFSALVAGSFSLGAIAAPLISPQALTLARFALAAALVGAAALATGFTARAVQAPWRYMILGALLACYFVLMFVGLQTAAAVPTAAVFTLSPIMAAFFGWVLLGQITTSRMWAALALGGTGALWVIFRGDLAALLRLDIGKGEVIYFFGCIAHSLYAPMVRKLNRGESALTFTFGTLVAGFLWLILWGGPAALATNWATLPAVVWITLAYIAIAASALTFVLLQYASLRLPSAKVMAYTYLVPAWVILWEVAIHHTIPPPTTAIGVALTATALLLLLKD